MEVKLSLTRRRALQGMLGLTAATVLPKSASAETTPAELPVQELAMGPTAGSGRLEQLSNGWRFHRGDAPGAEAPEFADGAWRQLEVPHDWSIEDVAGIASGGEGAIWTEAAYPLRAGPFDRYNSEGQAATGWTVGGIGWYRRTIIKPRLTPHGKVVVHFDGVYMNSDVWINGIHLGNHPYGYTEFSYDLTPHLKDGPNILAVRVNNFGRNSRWYSGSGIFRKVWLTNSGDIRIPEHGVWIQTPGVSRENAVVEVDVTVENGMPKAAQADVRVRVKNRKGLVAAESQMRVALGANSSESAKCAVELLNPHLWSPSEPYLYRVEVVAESAHQVVDSRQLSVGIRNVEIDALKGLRINGESVKLRGGCVHHDNGPLGSAAISRAEERRVERLKANGFNAIRTSHNPPSPDFLDACDRLGMLVMDEAFDCWEEGKNDDDYHKYFKEWWQRDLEAMVLRDRNHPSVVLWSIGNEIHERGEPRGVEIGKALAQRVHELDPSRKVTAAICPPWDHVKATWQDIEPAFSYLDVGGYNYATEQYGKDHAKFPDRVMVGTESFPGQMLQNWNTIEKSSWVLGDFVWTAIDYLGESGVGHSAIAKSAGAAGTMPYPWINAFCGDIDLIGNKKPQSYFRDVVWRRSPVEMAVQRPVPTAETEHVGMWGWSDELRSWTWPGFEGKPLKVRVYTRGDRVELFLNNKEVSTKDLAESDRLKAEFDIVYMPGELKAVAFENGKEIGTLSFTTAGDPHSIALAADRRLLKASRDDLSYIEAKVVDKNGQLVPDAVLPISFSIRGAGEIVAVGNANPKDISSFKQPRRNTYHGICVAIVRPATKPGALEVQATSIGLESARINLEVSIRGNSI